MKLKKVISFLLTLSTTLSLCLIPAFSANAKSSAQKYLDATLEEYGITGVVYVTKNGEVMCQSASGLANSQEGKEITTDTMFPIGSNSKQFCAAAILLLQEAGKLSTDDKISEYFPQYTVAADATVKDLLCMRSGILNHLIGLSNEEFILSTEATQEENQQIILDWLYEQELLFEPDTDFSYSNTNYLLLSLIVEKVSGQSYSDFIKENFFTPLGMNNSGFYEELINHPDLAEHTADYGDKPIEPELKGLTQGAGDIVSNAKDMDKWMTSLGKGTILSEESFEEMTTSYTPDEGYGYGLVVYGDEALFHNGGIVSYLSTTYTFPEHGLNIFVVSNDFDLGLTGKIDNITMELGYTFMSEDTVGDVNGDLDINVKDATRIQKYSAKFFNLDTIDLLSADVNKDDKVNIKDATAIQKYTAKIETNLPIGNLVFGVGE